VDLRKDPTIAAEVAKIKGTPLPAGQKPVLTNVQTVVGNTTNVDNGTIIDAYGRESPNFTGTVRPVAYIPLDQGGNIMGPGNDLIVIEDLRLAPGSTGKLPEPSGPMQSPPGGVFIDIQTLPQGTASIKIEQVVLTGQYPPGAKPDVRNATSAVATGINTISKSAETKTIDVKLGSSQKLKLKN